MCDKKFTAEVPKGAVLLATCQALTLSVGDVTGPRRYPHLVEARCIVAYLLDKHTEMYLLEIAEFMNRKTHFWAWHSLSRFDDFHSSCAFFRAKVEQVIKTLELKGYDC